MFSLRYVAWWCLAQPVTPSFGKTVATGWPSAFGRWPDSHALKPPHPRFEIAHLHGSVSASSDGSNYVDRAALSAPPDTVLR